VRRRAVSCRRLLSSRAPPPEWIGFFVAVFGSLVSAPRPRFSVCPDVTFAFSLGQLAAAASCSTVFARRHAVRVAASLGEPVPLLCLVSSTGSRFVVPRLGFSVFGLIFRSVGARTAVAVLRW
jgi:hypothetical protein